MKYYLCLAFGLAGLLGGCSRAEDQGEAVADGAPQPEALIMNARPVVVGNAATTATLNPDRKTANHSVIAPSRLLIYHADLRLKVPSLSRASASLDSLMQRNCGYLSASTEVREDGEWRQTMTIRVAPARFQPLLAALGGVGTVQEKKLTTDDVTAQHADIAARLATKRAVEKRYVDLLARAKKISEVLEIEGKIGEPKAASKC